MRLKLRRRVVATGVEQRLVVATLREWLFDRSTRYPFCTGTGEVVGSRTYQQELEIVMALQQLKPIETTKPNAAFPFVVPDAMSADMHRYAWEIAIVALGAMDLSHTVSKPVSQRMIGAEPASMPTVAPQSPGGAVVIYGDGISGTVGSCREPSFSVADASSLLESLSPDRSDDYELWVEVLMALHHQFAGTPDESDAIAAATAWSSQSGKYRQGDVEAKWRSFSRSKKGTEITIRSLRHWAVEDQKEELIARLNTRYAHLLKGGNAILETPPNGEPDFLDPRRWKEHFANEKILCEKKWVTIADYWLRHPKRRSFYTVIFDPRLPAYAGVPSKSGVLGELDFNLWPGFALKPSDRGSCEIFLSHLRDVVCGGDVALYDWMMQSLAHIVQRPYQIAGTALVLRGKQGAGKSIVGQVIGAILGAPLYKSISKPEELTGRFNELHQGCLLLQVEEGFWAGDKKAEGALKHMITSKTIVVERKYMEPAQYDVRVARARFAAARTALLEGDDGPPTC